MQITDSELLAQVHSLAADSRRTTVALIDRLILLEDRGLHLAEGFSTLFAFCVEALRMSEGEAGNRLMAVRAARRFPLVLELLRSGELNLTSVRILAPHLTDENHADVLRRASGRTRREVEELVVRLAPRPVMAPTLRALPAVAAPVAAHVSLPPQPALVRSVAPEVYRLSVNMSARGRELWQRMRELVWGDDSAILERLLEAAVPVLEKEKRAATSSPAPSRPTVPDSRHVPAHVKREVSRRDGDRCAFVSSSGHRCSERGHLEFHHVRNWMMGGATTVENIQLRCRAHNRYQAEQEYGPIRQQMSMV